MNDRETRRYQMFVRVRDFGASNTDSFQPSTLAAELFATLNTIVGDLSGHAVAQSTGDSVMRQGTATKAALRDELREDMISISRTARAIAIDSTGFEDKFRVPHNVSDQILLNSARTFATNAAPFVTEFVKHEMPADFLDQLNTTIKLFEKAVSDQNQGTETRLTATAAIDDTIERSMDIVRKLDAIVNNRFGNNPAKLAAWVSAKHTERSPRVTATPETSEPAVASKK